MIDRGDMAQTATTAQESMTRRLTVDARYVTAVEGGLVLLAAPFLLFPTFRPRLTAAALALLALAWLARWALRGEPWPHTPCNGALLLLAIMIPVGVWASAFPELTLPKLTGLILGLAAFRVTAFWVHDRRSLAWALAGFALLGLAILAGGALAGVNWPSKIPLLKALVARLPTSAASNGISPNELGGVLALYVPVAAACMAGWLAERRPLPALAALVGLLVAGAALALTQSRGAWLGAAAGLVALPALWGLGHRRRSVRVLAVAAPLVLLAAALAGALVYLGPPKIGQLLTGATAGDGVEGALGSISLAGRLEIWSRAVYAIKDFPFTGCGLGAFRRVVNLLYPLFLISPDSDIAHAHNIFLQTALDLGLPGLVAYLALLWTAGAAAWRTGRGTYLNGGSAGNLATFGRWAALGLLAGLLAQHVYGMTDAIALGAKPGPALWVALGLAAAMANVKRGPKTTPS